MSKSNLDRLKADVDALISKGQLLRYALQLDIHGESFRKQVEEKMKKADVEPFLKSLPKFSVEYEAWYSECVAVIKQLLPDRFANFVGLYEKPKNRKDITWSNYVIQDCLQGITVREFGKIVVGPSAAIPQFEQQQAILQAARRRFESAVFEIKQLVQADLFDAEIDVARELLKNKFIRAAGVVAGVVLEKHMLQVCGDRGLKIGKKNPSLADLNELLKANSVIDMPQWRHLSMLGDIRNLCAHNKIQEPSGSQVADLIDGTDKILKTVA